MSAEIPTRRSPVYRKTNADVSGLREINGYRVALGNGETGTRLGNPEKLEIRDVSWLPRAGFKGRDTVSWLIAQGVKLPEQVNALEVNDHGCLVIRLSRSEFLVLSDPGQPGELAVRLSEKWNADQFEQVGSYTYYLPRQDSHACFLIAGAHAPSVFSKLCAVDLRLHEFSNHAVAQTMMARLSVIIVRNDLSDVPAFLVLADSASAEYLWDSIMDAADFYLR